MKTQLKKAETKLIEAKAGKGLIKTKLVKMNAFTVWVLVSVSGPVENLLLNGYKRL